MDPSTSISNKGAGKKNPPRLGSVFEAPPFMKIPFILSGYRIGYNLTKCARSLLSVHNETMNIWTHLLPTFWFLFLAFLCMRLYVNGTSLGGNFDNLNLVELAYIACAISTTGISSTFHLFNCISSDVHKCLRTLDFVCISIMISGSSWSVMYYSLLCHLSVFYFWVAILVVITITGLYIPFCTFSHDNTFRLLRIGIFVQMALMPAVFFLQLVFLEGIHHPLVTKLFHNVGLSYLNYGVGLVIYTTRFPERIWPGSFDIWGNSHQIWHVLGFLGILYMYFGIANAKEWRTTPLGQCYPNLVNLSQ